MPDAEKVINGLEWCMNEKHDCYKEKGCPYENEGEDIGCKYALHRDALALLKAQEPIDAIPMDWMDAQIHGYASALKSTELKALIVVKGLWEKEQEAQK